MRVNGLIISYRNGMNVFKGPPVTNYPVGDLLCRIFQGETLYNITQILRNCIDGCLTKDDPLTQDKIEDAEYYILRVLLYDDFKPAQRLSQGSFIRCMECYRALDSSTADRVLCLEKATAEENDILYKAIGFDTVGNFLRLCCNSYIIDLENAICLFQGMAAMKSGTASSEEKAEYDAICQQLNSPDVVPGIEMRTVYDAGRGEFSYSYVISSFLAMTVFEFSHLAEAATKVLRCHNPECGKFFTAKRTSAKYCPFPSPQNPSRTCNDYYPQLIHQTKVRADAVLKMEKRALNRLYNDRRRHPEATAEIDNLLSTLQIESPLKRQDILKGKLTEIEYQAWLNTIRREKGESSDD